MKATTVARIKIAGLTKTSAKELVAVRNYNSGAIAAPGTREYEILLWSFENREDRSWYPNGDPEFFEVVDVITKFQGPDKNWNPVYAGAHFPWSYKKGFDDNPRARALNAARREIAEQIAQFARKGMHVHHAGVPFKDLFNRWLDSREQAIEAVGVTDIGEMGGLRFTDADEAADWRDFHARNASLQLVSPEEHKRIHAGY